MLNVNLTRLCLRSNNCSGIEVLEEGRLHSVMVERPHRRAVSTKPAQWRGSDIHTRITAEATSVPFKYVIIVWCDPR